MRDRPHLEHLPSCLKNRLSIQIRSALTDNEMDLETILVHSIEVIEQKGLNPSGGEAIDHEDYLCFLSQSLKRPRINKTPLVSYHSLYPLANIKMAETPQLLLKTTHIKDVGGNICSPLLCMDNT